MSRLTHCQLLLLSCLILCALAGAGCTGATRNGLVSGERTGSLPEQQELVEVPAVGPALPTPAELAELPDVPRRTSYMEADLFKNGDNYILNLPNQRVAPLGGPVQFSPNWSADTGFELQNLAYCTYHFFIPGYDREPEVRYGWETPPSELGTAWLGLSNWDTDSWDWFAFNQSGVQVTADFAPYISDTFNLLAVVLLASDEASSLRYIRLGHGAVDAALNTVAHTGVAPFDVLLSASASTTALGAIESYQWDFDGDGQYDLDTGMTPEANYIYEEVGQYSPVVRVVNSLGEAGEASTDLQVIEPWIRSWGGPSLDILFSVLADGINGFYGAGWTRSFGSGEEDILLLKYSLTGQLLWARVWGGVATDVAQALAMDEEGNLLVAGYTRSYGAGNADYLLQKWDAEGNLLWTRTWGGANYDSCNAIFAIRGYAYLAGLTHSFGGGNSDACLVKCDFNGNVDWARAWGGAGDEEAMGVAARYDLLSAKTEIYLTGGTTSYGAGNSDLFFLEYGDTGFHNTPWLWGDAEYQRGTAITFRSFLNTTDIYICGQTWDGNVGAPQRALLLEVSDTPLRATWLAAGLHKPSDLETSGDGSLLMCGTYENDAGGELVKLSDAGAVESAEIITQADSYQGLTDMQGILGNALLLAGYSGSAQGTSWTPIAGNGGDSTIDWQLIAGAGDQPDGATGSPDGILTDVTDAVEDSGGGSEDALVVLRREP